MPQINNETLRALREAHYLFENNKEKEFYVSYKDNERQYIQFVITKGDYYFGQGNYVVYDGCTFVGYFSGNVVNDLVQYKKIADQMVKESQ